MIDFYDRTHKQPIIAAVNNRNTLQDALNSPTEIIFLLNGDIMMLEETVKVVRESNKGLYIHIDLMEGLSKDFMSLKFVKEKVKPDGILTTKPNLIRHAKQLNMFVIQRLFIVDSISLETGIKSLQSMKPDAVEIMPGIMPKVVSEISKESKTPVIAGGLIHQKSDIIASLNAGAIAISTSKKEVWYK
ncbi:glycerol-3-phosphate responsive antiterminator [Proteinivorax hydrogeniformans]|uniref:Glycerol-3-phosphate responsive antiterminator n=1 Tax=Proteinivorax hydrogeniformans TaxID=1826727 RepID=A0AAU8HVW9_9FIRM